MSLNGKVPKNNMKSVRISDEVLAIVESYYGEGFNQKFENLVIDFKKTQPEREAYKEALDATINQQVIKLGKIKESISKAERVKSSMDKFLESLEF